MIRYFAAPADHEIRIPRAAFLTPQQPRPTEDRHPRAVLHDLNGDVRLGAMAAAFAAK